MKKVVIILLLVLPFILIYFISVTGRILEKYSHIYVESLKIQDLEDNDIIPNKPNEIRVGNSKQFKIVIGPELASNPSVLISCYNNDICSYTEENGILTVTALKYGQTTIIVSSVDRTNITASFIVKVIDDVPTGLQFAQKEMTAMPGKTYDITPPSFIPSTTKEQFKGLVWESSDEEIVKIVDANGGRIKALKEGEVIITAKSIFNSEIFATIKVNVTNQKFTDVYFDYYDTSAYVVNDKEFNLYSIIKYSDNFMNQYPEEERTNQYFFKLETNVSGVDVSKLSDGLIVFDDSKSVILIKIGIYMVSDPDSQVDLITIVFNKK